MKIASVQYRLPSKCIKNDEILDDVVKHSQSNFNGDIKRLRGNLAKLFELAGSQERRVLDKGEKPIQLMRGAADRALEQAGWRRDDIELLIYVGIGKGFIEPANAYITAQSLGILRADCFDLVDACMSWVRALYIVKNLMETQQYSRVMLVNAEFNHALHGFSENMNFQDLSQLEHRFAGLTVGEAASVTCLERDENSFPWKFQFSTRPDLADLCTIPNPYHEMFYDYETDRVGKNGPYRFTSFSTDLHEVGLKECLNTFKPSGISKGDFDHVFTHTSSGNFWANVANALGLLESYFNIFPKTGNIVSASLPVGMAMAEESGKLKRNDRVLGLVGSAGMSFCAFSFNY